MKKNILILIFFVSTLSIAKGQNDWFADFLKNDPTCSTITDINKTTISKDIRYRSKDFTSIIQGNIKLDTAERTFSIDLGHGNLIRIGFRVTKIQGLLDLALDQIDMLLKFMPKEEKSESVNDLLLCANVLLNKFDSIK